MLIYSVGSLISTCNDCDRAGICRGRRVLVGGTKSEVLTVNAERLFIEQAGASPYDESIFLWGSSTLH